MKIIKLEKRYVQLGITLFLVVIASMLFNTIIQQWPGISAFFGRVNGYLTPFLWGFILAYLLNPVVRFFQSRAFEPLGGKLFKKGDVKHKAASFGRAVAVTVSILLLLAVVAVLLWQVLPQVYKSVEGLLSNITSGLERFQAWSSKWLDGMPELKSFLQSILGDVGESFTTFAKNSLMPYLQNLSGNLFSTAVTAVSFVGNVIIAIVASIFMLYNKEKFVAQCKKLLYSICGARKSKSVLGALRFTDRTFIGFILGKLLESLILGVVVYIASLIVGVPDPALMGVLMGVCNIIPFFGPIIGAVISGLIVLVNGTWGICLVYVIVVVVIMQVDGYVVAPRILGNSTNLSGFWIIFSVMFCAGLFGPIGMIIGVPLFAIFYALVKWCTEKHLKKKNLPVATDDYYDLYYIDPTSGEEVKWRYPTPEEQKAAKEAKLKELRDKKAKKRGEKSAERSGKR